MSAKAPGVRLNQAILLLAGALFLVFIVAPDDERFYWTPLTIGLAYLGAAIAGGRDGGHWATACALTGWGAAVVLAGAARPDLDVSGLYLTGAGLGATAGLLLQRAGFSVNPMGLAVTITGGGLALALTTQAPGLLDDARTYAALIAAVAAGNIAIALTPRLQRARTQPPATPPEHHTQDPNLDREVTYD
jgi:hypothetical protein